MRKIDMKHLSVLALLVLVASAGAQGEASTEQTAWKPTLLPQLDVQRASGSIRIDGDLSDAGWRGAAVASGFTEHSPGEEVEPPVRTEVFVTYDEAHLYLSAICYTDPATVRASMCERERIFDDDNIGFFFDTYGDASRAYIINLNPYGIPYDALWSPNNGEDGNFDLIFESSGKVTDSGYQVEMAIPFRSLRFPNKPVQEWRFDFYRHHDREVPYSMSWAAYDKDEDCWPCQWGTIRGIHDVAPGRGMELIGSYVAQQSGWVENSQYPHDSFVNDTIDHEVSFSGKYAVTSDIVLEGTYNPDFSQIEADASQVDVNSTFALFYSEKRPFFQESMDIFQTNFFAVYTRTIQNPDFAVKGSAKLGRTSAAVMSAHDESTPVTIPLEEGSVIIRDAGRSYVNLLALRRSFRSDDHIRMVVTDRRYEGGGSGSLASLDGAFRLHKKVRAYGQAMLTHTEEPGDPGTVDPNAMRFDGGEHTVALDGEKFSGSAALAGVNYNSRRAFASVRTYQRTPTYRAENGHQPRNNDRWVIGEGGYEFLPKGTMFRAINPRINATRIYNFDGIRKDEWISVSMWTGYRFAQAQLWMETGTSNERYHGKDFRDIWWVTLNPNAAPLEWFSLGGYFDYGKRIARRQMQLGMQTHAEAWWDIRPAKRLQTSYSYVFERSQEFDTDREYFNQSIFRARVSYQFTRRLSFRLVGEFVKYASLLDNGEVQRYEAWSIDPLITYRINPFSTFYAGSNYDFEDFAKTAGLEDRSDWALRQRQFFVKIQYLFRT